MMSPEIPNPMRERTCPLGIRYRFQNKPYLWEVLDIARTQLEEQSKRS